MSKRSTPHSPERPSTSMGSSMPEMRRPRPPYSSKEQQLAALVNHVDYDKHIARLNKTVRSWDVPVRKAPETPHVDRSSTHWKRTKDLAKRPPSSIERLSDDARKAWNAMDQLQINRRQYTHKLDEVARELAQQTTRSRKELEKQKRALEQRLQETTNNLDTYKKELASNRPDILEEHRQHRLAKRQARSDRAKHNLKVHDNVTRGTRSRIAPPKPRRKVSTGAP